MSIHLVSDVVSDSPNGPSRESLAFTLRRPSHHHASPMQRRPMQKISPPRKTPRRS